MRTTNAVIEAEASFLGGLLIDPILINDFKDITPDDFSDARHVIIYSAILELHEADEPIDFVTVATRVNSLGKIEEIGGAEYIAEIQNGVPVATHTPEYAKTVRHNALLRELKVTGRKIAEIEGTPDDILQKLVFELSGIKKKLSNINPEISAEDIDPIDKTNTILTWGTDGLDKVISPIEPHFFVVLTGESGHGKTAFTFDMAIKNSKIGKVLYISLEMGESEILTRIAMNHAAITKEQWRDKEKIGEGQRNVYKVKRAELKELGKLKTVGLKDSNIENICRTILKHKPVLAIVDNMDLIDKTEKEQLAHEASVSKRLMNFTNKNKIPVILIHHLKKGKEGGKGTRGLNAVKGSSKIVHDADSVIMCHRTLSSTERMSLKQKAQFTVVEKKDRTFGVGGVKTIFFHKGSFYDEYVGKEETKEELLDAF